MARYEIKINPPAAGWTAGSWRLVQWGTGSGGPVVIQESRTAVGKFTYLPYGPFMLKNVEIDLGSGKVAFDKQAASLEGFRKYGPQFMSSYVLDFGDDRFGFFLDGSRRPDRKVTEEE
ncbi:hypothetical protein ACFFIY_07585 [Bhargavaea ullalensis]|uniref:Uncharacterized protein n=1 Tax=Bhargavaea ullalensis TaxID=1265685 RepID=A0ABV2GB26_9BACL